MAKDPCCSGCDGCLNLLLEAAALLAVFGVAVGATLWPLLGH